MPTSRRDFLATISGAASALSGAGALFAMDADPRLAPLLARAIAIDMHSHIGIPFGNPGAPLPRFDLAGEMKRTGFAAVLQTYEVDSVRGSVDKDYPRHLEALDFEDRVLAANGVRRALSLADLQAAHGRGQPIIVQSAEGAQFLQGKIERLDEAYRRGLRNLQLVHERDDSVAPLSDVYSRAPRYGGLTPFGADVIRTCNRLGIVVDLTHMSFDAVKAALKISSQPMIYSHTSLQPGPNDRPSMAMLAPRLLSAEQSLAIAADGGVIGVWRHGSETAAEYVGMIKRLADVVGIDHVGIGTDSDLEPGVQRTYTNAIWKNETRGFVPAVVAEMLGAGFTPQEITGIVGGNFCRVFGAVTGARTSGRSGSQ